MAQHADKKTPRPALVFAGAIAVVALLAVPLLLFTGGEEPVVVGTTTTTAPPASSTTAPTATTATTAPPMTSTTAPTSTTTTVQNEEIISVSGVVFLIQTPENSYLGNPALIPVGLEVSARGVFDNDPDMLEALAAIAKYGGELPAGLESSIPADVQIVSQRVEGDTIVADMSPAFVDGAGGLLADVTMLNQLVYTLTYGTSQDRVRFTVGGEAVEAYGAEGIVLTEPVSRDDYLDDLAPIFLTEPIAEFEHVYAVTGRANVFEASLSVRVLDGNGAVVHEEPTQASCGTGCWGDFGVGISSDLIVPGVSSVQVLTHSGEDGSDIDVITVPIPSDGIWKQTIND